MGYGLSVMYAELVAVLNVSRSVAALTAAFYFLTVNIGGEGVFCTVKRKRCALQYFSQNLNVSGNQISKRLKYFGDGRLVLRNQYTYGAIAICQHNYDQIRYLRSLIKIVFAKR